MPRHNITNAEDLFTGEAQYNRANNALNGIPMTPLFLADLDSPIVGDVNGLVLAATSTELPNNETVTYTFPGSASPLDAANTTGVLDFPRNITSVTSHASSIVAMTILVTGTDEYGAVVSELITVPATGTSTTVDGAKAFLTVTSIAITATTDAEANTLNMGFGDVLGLPYRVDAEGLVGVIEGGTPLPTLGTFVAAVTTDPATTTTGDVRGTYNPTQTLDGTLNTKCLIQVAGRSSRLLAFGVDQV